MILFVVFVGCCKNLRDEDDDDEFIEVSKWVRERGIFNFRTIKFQVRLIKFAVNIMKNLKQSQVVDFELKI